MPGPSSIAANFYLESSVYSLIGQQFLYRCGAPFEIAGNFRCDVVIGGLDSDIHGFAVYCSLLTVHGLLYRPTSSVLAITCPCIASSTCFLVAPSGRASRLSSAKSLKKYRCSDGSYSRGGHGPMYSFFPAPFAPTTAPSGTSPDSMRNTCLPAGRVKSVQRSK